MIETGKVRMIALGKSFALRPALTKVIVINLLEDMYLELDTDETFTDPEGEPITREKVMQGNFNTEYVKSLLEVVEFIHPTLEKDEEWNYEEMKKNIETVKHLVNI